MGTVSSPLWCCRCEPPFLFEYWPEKKNQSIAYKYYYIIHVRQLISLSSAILSTISNIKKEKFTHFDYSISFRVNLSLKCSLFLHVFPQYSLMHIMRKGKNDRIYST